MKNELKKTRTAEESAARYNRRVARIARVLRQTFRQMDQGRLSLDVKNVPDSRLLARTIVENAL